MVTEKFARENVFVCIRLYSSPNRLAKEILVLNENQDLLFLACSDNVFQIFGQFSDVAENNAE